MSELQVIDLIVAILIAIASAISQPKHEHEPTRPSRYEQPADEDLVDKILGNECKKSECKRSGK